MARWANEQCKLTAGWVAGQGMGPWPRGHEWWVSAEVGGQGAMSGARSVLSTPSVVFPAPQEKPRTRPMAPRQF